MEEGYLVTCVHGEAADSGEVLQSQDTLAVVSDQCSTRDQVGIGFDWERNR